MAKKQYIVLERNGIRSVKIYTCDDKSGFEARCAEKGYTVTWARSAPPTLKTLEKYMENGIAKATDGCRIEPDGTCQHGHHSWLIVLGLI
jgi:hypothetical protein